MKTEVRYKRVQSHYMKENDIWVIPSTFYACFMHSEGLRDIFLFHMFNVHALLFIHVRQIWYIMIFSDRIIQTRPQNFLLLFIFNSFWDCQMSLMCHKMHENFYEPDYGFSYAFVFYCMTFMILIVLNERARNGDGFVVKIFSHETLWIWRWIWHHKA